MKLSLLIVLLILTGCTYDAKKSCEFSNGAKAFMGAPLDNCQRFTYSDGYTEDLFLCHMYPTFFDIRIRADGIDFAKHMAEYYGKRWKLKFDNIECELVR